MFKNFSHQSLAAPGNSATVNNSSINLNISSPTNLNFPSAYNYFNVVPPLHAVAPGAPNGVASAALAAAAVSNQQAQNAGIYQYLQHYQVGLIFKKKFKKTCISTTNLYSISYRMR